MTDQQHTSTDDLRQLDIAVASARGWTCIKEHTFTRPTGRRPGSWAERPIPEFSQNAALAAEALEMYGEQHGYSQIYTLLAEEICRAIVAAQEEMGDD